MFPGRSSHPSSPSVPVTSKPPSRPLPHKISLLNNHQSSPFSSSTSVSTKSTAPAVNPYLPNGSPGLIRRHRIADAIGSTSAQVGRSAIGDGSTMPTPTPGDIVAANAFDNLVNNNFHSRGRPSSQSAPSEWESVGGEQQQTFTIHSSFNSSSSSLQHQLQHSVTYSSTSPSPAAKAKPPPPPRRSSLCKSDKNLI